MAPSTLPSDLPTVTVPVEPFNEHYIYDGVAEPRDRRVRVEPVKARSIVERAYGGSPVIAPAVTRATRRQRLGVSLAALAVHVSTILAAAGR